MKKLMLLAAVLVGCGGGVSDSKKLSDLTAAEAKEACEEMADDYPERTVTCESGGQTFTLTLGIDKADCATDSEPAPATCTATVGDARDCYDAFYSLTDAEICSSDSEPAACAKLEGC